jgi:hypothetical protein
MGGGQSSCTRAMIWAYCAGMHSLPIIFLTLTRFTVHTDVALACVTRSAQFTFQTIFKIDTFGDA